MAKVSNEALKQLFTEARSQNGWLNKEVTNEQLHEIYELMKWGPTSANLNPARIIFIKSEKEKDRLLLAVAKGNLEKVKAAPVTAIIAQDNRFFDHSAKLFPHFPQIKDHFSSNASLSESTAFRNSSLQGAYFILAARAVGLDCGPMSGFDNAKLDELFFADTDWKSNFICTIGHGDSSKVLPRLPRLSFGDACKII
jgi:nitroreductase